MRKRCEKCQAGFEARKTGGSPQRYCSARCRLRHKAEIGRRALRRSRAARGRKARLGSKDNPLLVAQCPDCHLIYAVAWLPETADAARCARCRDAAAAEAA